MRHSNSTRGRALGLLGLAACAIYVTNADASGVTRLAEGFEPSWGPR
jgi:hypothetical protein